MCTKEKGKADTVLEDGSNEGGSVMVGAQWCGETVFGMIMGDL